MRRAHRQGNGILNFRPLFFVVPRPCRGLAGNDERATPQHLTNMKAQSLSSIAKELKVPIRRLRAIEGDRCKKHGMPANMLHGTDWRGKPDRKAATFAQWLGEGYAYYAGYREACAYLNL